MPKYIGKPIHKINVSEEYWRLAAEDEETAIFLNRNDKHRHAMYFLIQAMEKYVRSKIFTLVNPNIEYFRNKNKNHSLENALKFLFEILSDDEMVKSQIKEQLYHNVLGNIQFFQLHNNLRYPWYLEKFNSYSVLEITKTDFNEVFDKLESLKAFLKDIHKLVEK